MAKKLSLLTTALIVLLGVLTLVSPNIQMADYVTFIKTVSPLLITLSGSIGVNSLTEKLTNKEDKCGEED